MGVTATGVRCVSPGLHEFRVGDVMHTGVISCSPDAPLRSVARMLASYRVHAIVVLPRHAGDVTHAGSWRIVTDVDVARAAIDAVVDAVTAGEAAGSPVCVVPPGELLGRAVETMLADRLSHVVVVDRYAGRPVGVLSLHDVARALADQAAVGVSPERSEPARSTECPTSAVTN
jgi:CBS domain-containing protein